MKFITAAHMLCIVRTFGVAFENGSSFSLSTESRPFFLYAFAVYLQKKKKKNHKQKRGTQSLI